MQTLAENKRARFDYEILDTFLAGVEFSGQEVKSVKLGQMNLSGSYVLIRGGEAWLLNAQIPPYQPKNAPEDYDPARTRRLLLTKEELRILARKLEEKGLALIPLRALAKKALVKMELALGKSRKKGDKRELLKKRAVLRELRQG